MNFTGIRRAILFFATALLLVMNASAQQVAKRIVSLNGAITEIVCALGFEKAIVGVDVTSTYPASMHKVPKVGHNRNISAEPVLALQPDLDKIIALAGAQNAAGSFNDFKPLTPEALVTADPDVILMFEDGLKSMGGIDGLLKVQGVIQTTAGKQKKVIVMDGQLLTGFGPRVVQAVKELSGKLNS